MLKDEAIPTLSHTVVHMQQMLKQIADYVVKLEGIQVHEEYL